MNTIETLLPAAAVKPLLSRGQVPEAAAVLYRAFAGYPLLDYLFENQPRERRAAFKRMFAALIESRLIRRWPVLTTSTGNRLTGVAVITSPDDTPGEDEADALFEQAADAIGPDAVARFFAYADACDAGLPDWPHHYLGILGVDPEFQGRHYGSALVEATQAIAREHPTSRGIVLNTESPLNVAYYEQLGFRQVHTERLGWVTTWTLVWQPEEEWQPSFDA